MRGVSREDLVASDLLDIALLTVSVPCFWADTVFWHN